MNGFWTIQFTGVPGFGFGIIILIDGKLFGGDTTMLYVGTYTQDGNAIRALLHIKLHGAALAIPETPPGEEYRLELNGRMDGETIAATGTIAATNMYLSANLTRRGNF